MGGLFGGGQVPKPPPPPPPPPQLTDPSIQAAAVKAKAAMRNRRGRASTILQGAQEQLGSPQGSQTLG